jgi:large subunit ribosomal protein L15
MEKAVREETLERALTVRLHELKGPDGARTRRKRVGRGTASGHGKTSGRGQKGQDARNRGFRLGFEGGQMPLAQRLPKLGGFKNPFKVDYAIVNLGKLSRFEDGATVDSKVLVEAGLADPGKPVKVLGAGKLRRKLTVEADVFSESARTAIEARGGKAIALRSAGEASAAPQPAGETGPIETSANREAGELEA